MGWINVTVGLGVYVYVTPVSSIGVGCPDQARYSVWGEFSKAALRSGNVLHVNTSPTLTDHNK